MQDVGRDLLVDRLQLELAGRKEGFSARALGDLAEQAFPFEADAGHSSDADHVHGRGILLNRLEDVRRKASCCARRSRR